MHSKMYFYALKLQKVTANYLFLITNNSIYYLCNLKFSWNHNISKLAHSCSCLGMQTSVAANVQTDWQYLLPAQGAELRTTVIVKDHYQQSAGRQVKQDKTQKMHLAIYSNLITIPVILIISCLWIIWDQDLREADVA